MSEPRWTPLGTRILSLGLALGGSTAVVLLLLLFLSDDVAGAAALFFAGPFRNAFNLGNMVGEMGILVLAGLGASLAFSARTYNLGGEGQVYLGAVVAVAICLAQPTGDPLLVPLEAALGGASASALLSWSSARLKLSLGVDELISSFLLSAVVVYLCDFLVTGPLQDRTSNFQATAAIPPAFAFPRILPPSSLSLALLPALAILGAAVYARARTRFGYELGLVGLNREFARYAGIDTDRYATLPMALSGFLYGLAGAFLVLGTYHRVMKGFSAGLGWAGLSVALVAGNAPAAVLPAAFLLAYLNAGAKAVMVGANVTQDMVSVVEAAVFFLVTARLGEAVLPWLRKGRGGRA